MRGMPPVAPRSVLLKRIHSVHSIDGAVLKPESGAIPVTQSEEPDTLEGLSTYYKYSPFVARNCMVVVLRVQRSILRGYSPISPITTVNRGWHNL